MKYNSLRAFEKHLEGASPGHFSNVYMLISKEPYEYKTAGDKLIALLLSGQSQSDLCLKVFDCDNLDLNELTNELNTLTLFSPKQVILLQNADKLSAQGRTTLEPYIAKPSPTLFLIITASAINHSTNFYKKAEKSGVILEIPEQKPWEKEKVLLEWVMAEAAAAGKKMDQHVSQCLMKQIGMDQTMLHSELEKLFCYIGERDTVTINDISAICASVNIETVWQLGEALFRRDGSTAMRIGKALLDDGTAFLGLLRQIRGQFQTEFQICSILASGGNSNDVTQRFPYMRGNILERHMGMAQSYGMKSFSKGMQQIDAVEVMAKNSSADHEVLAELLIAKLVLQ